MDLCKIGWWCWGNDKSTLCIHVMNEHTFINTCYEPLLLVSSLYNDWTWLTFSINMCHEYAWCHEQMYIHYHINMCICSCVHLTVVRYDFDFHIEFMNMHTCMNKYTLINLQYVKNIHVFLSLSYNGWMWLLFPIGSYSCHPSIFFTYPLLLQIILTTMLSSFAMLSTYYHGFLLCAYIISAV